MTTPTGLPGSCGEHALQEAFGSESRARAFYRNQVLDHLNAAMRRFIGEQGMVFVATADGDGECDCSFRAGPPGFVCALDEHTIAYPEYRGNGVYASLGNVAENPHVGLLFIDFFRDTVGLHVNGTAAVVGNEALLLRPDLPAEVRESVGAGNGRRPERWVLVHVEEAYIHCSKHIPLLARLDKEIHWGTDDIRKKGGDYFHAKQSERPSAPPPTNSAKAHLANGHHRQGEGAEQPLDLVRTHRSMIRPQLSRNGEHRGRQPEEGLPGRTPAEPHGPADGVGVAGPAPSAHPSPSRSPSLSEPAPVPTAPIERPAWRRWLSRGFLRCLLSHPAPVITLSGLVGWLNYNFSPHNPSPEEVGDLLQHLPRRRLCRIAREIRALAFKNTDLMAILQHAGIEGALPLVRCRGGERLQAMYARKSPAILTSWHSGANYLTIVAGLQRLGVPALFLAGNVGARLPRGFELLDTGNDPVSRSRAIRKTLAHLGAGGILVIALDGDDGTSTLDVPCLGRKLSLRRGPAVLARLSGAPLIPITQSWQPWGGTINVTIHDSLPLPAHSPEDRDAFDAALLAEAARWYEDYVRANPETISYAKLRWFLETPKAVRGERAGEPHPPVAAAGHTTTNGRSRDDQSTRRSLSTETPNDVNGR